MTAQPVEYALRYAALGLPVLPVRPGSKIPLTGNGLHDATTDAQTITRFWSDTPDANIGLALGPVDLVAIDIDPRNGGTVEALPEVPVTLHARTGGGGEHFILRAPPGARFPGKYCQGVDIKANGYIVVEPSVHESGNRYAWDDWDPLVEPLPQIAAAPAWLADKPGPSERGPASSGGSAKFDLAASIREVMTGETYHDNLARAAAHYVATGMAKPDVIKVLEGVMLAGADRSERWKARFDEIPRAVSSAFRKFARPAQSASTGQVSLGDFWALLPEHKYICTDTRDLWPAASVDGRITDWPINPLTNKEMRPSAFLDANRSVEQVTWCPGLPTIIRDRIVQAGGWIDRPGFRVFNLYRPPAAIEGEPADAWAVRPWREHLYRIYPTEAEHMERWLAFKVQNPGVKINHALFMGGSPGMGKDTTLEPVKYAVGAWNWSEISPAQMPGRFNAWAKSVIVRVSEARDLGDVDRYAFHDHSKVYIAAPPDVIRVDEKNLREHSVFNVCGVIITTNHATDGIYLPPDDRRHFVAWSEAVKEDFPEGYWRELWGWYEQGGLRLVASYLAGLDLAGFDPKAPPPKTAAFWRIVQANCAPEDGELRDVIERAGRPPALTVQMALANANACGFDDLAYELQDRKNRRALPHKFERAGYGVVRNPDAEDGLWRIDGRRQVVYADRALALPDQVRAARALARASVV